MTTHIYNQRTIDELRAIAESPHASDTIREAIATAIDQVRVANEIATDHARRFQDTAAALRDLERTAPTEIAAAIRAGRIPRIDTITTRVAKARQARQEASEASRLVDQAYSTVATALGRVYLDHAPDLARLIARYRTDAGHKCGRDAMPAWVLELYRNHRWSWWPAWDPALDIDPWRTNGTEIVSHLPIDYQITWSAPIRASLVWIWAEIAGDRFEFANHPKRGRCLRLIEWCRDLPPVPPTPRQR